MPYPFYYYNTSEGYYWVEADSCVHRQLAYKPDCYLCELCVHEKKDRAVIAYRFTNYVTFYNLEGNIGTNIRIGQTAIAPKWIKTGALDTENTTKCLLDVCGTPDYLYCLYSGSADYATPTYLIAFHWNGKPYKTWQLDSYIRTMSVTNDNKTCYVVRSLPNKAQAISYYTLK